jgi:hypothetical protein
MKKILLIFAIFFSLTTQAQKYKITRYEQKSDALFICINHKTKPVYVEKFLSADERKDTASIVQAIEFMVADLMIKADAYKEPEKFVSKPEKAKRFEAKTDTVRVNAKKAAILAKALAVKDSTARIEAARVEAAKVQPVINEAVEPPTEVKAPQ